MGASSSVAYEFFGNSIELADRKEDKKCTEIINKIDCQPDISANEEKCIAKGCCWKISDRDPWCFSEASEENSSFMVIRGNYACKRSGMKCSTDQYCAQRSETTAKTVELAVMCCNSESIGFRKTCISNVNFHTAMNVCKHWGLRLCTADEIKAGSGEATGCGFDDKLIWTSTSCKPTEGKAYKKSKFTSCKDKSKTKYKSLETAQKACNEDSECTGIYDRKCEGERYKICKGTKRSSKSSCLWTKAAAPTTAAPPVYSDEDIDPVSYNCEECLTNMGPANRPLTWCKNWIGDDDYYACTFSNNYSGCDKATDFYGCDYCGAWYGDVLINECPS